MSIVETVKKVFRPKRQTEVNNGQSLLSTTGLHLSQDDRIRRLIRMELFRREVNDQAETFDEANDFDLPDGEEWVSPYEEGFDPPSETPPPVSAESATTPPPAVDPPQSPPAA